MNKKQIKEFLERLEGKEGCNFRKDKNGETTWKCKGGMNKDLSIKILDKMGISRSKQEEFLGRCTLSGGHCDCEILFNAAEKL